MNRVLVELRLIVCLVGALAVSLVAMPHRAAAAAEAQTNRIRVEYLAPKNPAYNPVFERLKERGALEKLQEVFSPFRFPSELTLRTVDCDGVANAWYDRDHHAVSVCYEYVAEFLKSLPEETTPAGITRTDAAIGQFFYVFAHEMGHAVFDVFKIPLMGDEEMAADHFATYIMLRFGKDQARRLIGGAAYTYHRYLQNPEVTAPLAAFSDVHGAPAQRFYNLICLAYGANPTVFAEVVDKGYLPKERAHNCKREYDQVAYAFRNLISPHIDQNQAKQVLDKTWLPPENVNQ